MSQINVDTVRNRTSTNGGPTFDKGLTVSAGTTAYVYGNLQVDGTETIVNTERLDVADKTVGIASTTAASNSTADGAGIEVYGGAGGNKTITWVNSTSNWTLGGGGLTADSAIVGSAVTINASGIKAGIITANTFSGSLAASNLTGALPAIDGSALTGVAATDNINTNNIAISGIATVGTSITMRDGAINVTGIVTAKAFVPTVGQLSHRNIVSNGAMRIAQRGSSSTSTGFKAMDRFRMSAGNASHTFTQSQTAITSGSPYDEGFRYVFKILNAGQDAHTSAECSIMHTIEAQDIANSGWNYTSASSYVTLSFWVKSSVTQTHLLTLHTNDTVTKEYNHLISLTADAWTKVTLVIPGHADIVMNDDNGTGFQIIMYGALGTAYTSGSTVDQWVTHSGYTSRPDMGQTWWTTDNSTLEYTGVQLEVGSAATPFEHRSYHDDLIACQRYYYHLVAGSNEFFPVIGMADVDGNTIVLNTPFSVVMRTAPTAVEQSGTAGDYKIRRSTTQTCTSVPTFVHATLNQAVTNFTKSSHGWGDGSAVRCMGANASAFLAWSAEI